jgi:hypothetical protein
VDSVAPRDARFALAKLREAARGTHATSVRTFLFRQVALRLSCSTSCPSPRRHRHQRGIQTHGLHCARMFG